LSGVVCISGDGAGGEGVDPILVPEEVQEMRVQRGLEVAHFQWVVLFAVDSKILNLLQWDGLVLSRGLVRWLVTLHHTHTHTHTFRVKIPFAIPIIVVKNHAHVKL
jgi:hypothetical protein